MAKKKKKNISKMIGEINDTINVHSHADKRIPDIIEFCNSKDYLGLPHLEIPIYLYPYQELILKVFYMGSEGNEHLEFTEKDRELCVKLGLTSDEQGDLIEKARLAQSGENLHRELVLVLGRRSGKDFISSIIALYEAMKLIEYQGGSPYKKYGQSGLASSAPFTILTVANSSKQAKIAFGEIREKIMKSSYFINRIGPEGLESSAIWLTTDQDLKDIAEQKARGLPPAKKGSIVIEVGHSNSDSLLGKSVFVLILDEVATYKNTGGSSSGERIIQALSPALNTYSVWEREYDENGEVKLDEEGNIVFKDNVRYDSKILAISSPRGKEGLLWNYYTKGHSSSSVLLCRLPTWLANPNMPRDSLDEERNKMTDEQFMMEFGAEFSGTAGSSFFILEKVDDVFQNNMEFKKQGEPGKVYFAHLDPASTSHNYALVVVHKEQFMNTETQRSDFVIVVDHIKYWHPTPGYPILPSLADQYLINLKSHFNIRLVTYDQWNNIESIERLKKAGIPHRLTRYNRSYKMKIYSELFNLVVSGRLKCPYHKLLREEMLTIQRKPTENGFKVFAREDENGVFSDDIADALAGASYSAMVVGQQQLPSGRLVEMGTAPSANSRMWQGMQGPIGYGTGQQVSHQLERLKSWPNYKR